MASSVPASKYRIIYFDFDCTLAVFHVWKALAGYEDHGPNCGWSKIPGPFYMQERGQLSRVIELGKDWSVICMGGASRLEALRTLLRRIHAEPGHRMAVMSKGCVGTIKKILTDVDLLRYFDRVFAANYGEDACEGIVLPGWAQELCATLDDWIEDTTDAKLATMNRDMVECRGLSLAQAVLVDDDINEIQDVSKYMDGVHVQSRGGFGYGEALELMVQLGLSPYGFVRPESAWDVPIHPSQERRTTHTTTSKSTADFTKSIVPFDGRSRLPAPAPPPEPSAQDRLNCCYSPDALDFEELGACVDVEGTDRATTLAELLEISQEEALLAKVCKKYVITSLHARGRFGTTMLVRPRNGQGSSTGLRFLKRVGKSRVADLTKYKKNRDLHLYPLADLFVGDDHAFVVTQSALGKGGDLIWALARLAEKAGTISAAWVARVVRAVAEGLVFLHENLGAPHGSVRPENILVDHAPEDLQDLPDVKLADFACSRRSARQAVTRFSCPFTAPEVVVRDEDSTPASDVWSLGATLSAAVRGSLHRKNVSAWQKFVDTCKGFLNPQEASNCNELIGLLTVAEPTRRPKMAAVLQHPFLKFQAGVTGQYCFPASVCRAHKAHDRARRLHKPFLHLVEQRARQRCEATKAAFAEVDTNGNGYLNTEEFNAYWEGVKAFDDSQLRKPSSTGVLCLVDSNDDGQIEGMEFANFHYSLRALDKDAIPRHLENAFTSLVGQERGLTPALLKGLFPSEPAAAVQALFDEMDIEDAGVVSLEVFQDYVIEHCALKLS